MSSRFDVSASISAFACTIFQSSGVFGPPTRSPFSHTAASKTAFDTGSIVVSMICSMVATGSSDGPREQPATKAHPRNPANAGRHWEIMTALLARSLMRSRQRDAERAAAARRWLQRQMSPADLDRPLRDRQPEAASGALIAAQLVAAIEPVEDARRRVGGDART